MMASGPMRSPDEPSGGDAGVRRDASMSIRPGSGDAAGAGDGGRASALDPANQSLADALRITFRVLQFAMIVLVVLYALSGFQTIKEGERGMRLLFGAVKAQNLEPGFQWSAPFPLGELVRVSGGANEVRVDDAFWVEVPAGTARDTSPDKLAPTSSLKPADRSGSVLTADGSIAHARVSAVYRRENAYEYARHILPEHEQRIVRLAIQRGVVNACAGAPIDELLKQAGGDASTVGGRARASAQEFLDALASGIVIDSLNIEAMPPLYVRKEFANVQAAVSQAAKAIAAARSHANETLSTMAGEASDALLEAIAAYEATLAGSDERTRQGALAKIDAILDGEPVGAGTRAPRVSGQVAQIIAKARQSRADVVSRRRADLALFEAKLEQYRSNSRVMLVREWSRAMAKFLERPTVELMLVPPGTRTLQLVLNPDPTFRKKMEERQRELEGIKAQEKRAAELRDERYRTQTGVITSPQ